MTLSNRLWRAIAWRWRDSPEAAQICVWAKVWRYAHGKRHFHVFIPLNWSQTGAVVDALMRPADDYLRFLVQHEREHNPRFVL